METHTQSNTDITELPVIQSIEFKDTAVQVLKNNMILLRFKKNCVVNAQHFKTAIQAAMQMLNKPRYKVIVLAEPGVVFTKEGLAYSNSYDHMKHKIAWASVSENKSKVFFTNLIQHFKAKKVPFKMFRRVDEAVNWLESN